MEALSDINRNPWPGCAALDLHPPRGVADGRFTLVADLRCGWHDILNNDCSMQVGVSEGVLRLHLQDCRVVPGSRYADATIDPTVKQDVKFTEERSVSRGASFGAKVGLGADGPSSTLGAQGAVDKKVIESVQSSVDHVAQRKRVRSEGPDRQPSWRVSTLPGERVLAGHYLGDTVLCGVLTDGRTFVVEASFTCLPKQVVVENIELRGWRFFSVNKRKIVSRLVAKTLETPNGIALSTAIINGPDETTMG